MPKGDDYYNASELFKVTLNETSEDGETLTRKTIAMVDCNDVAYRDESNMDNSGLTSKDKGATYRLALCPESGSISVHGMTGTQLTIESKKSPTDEKAEKTLRATRWASIYVY